tara:strand:- start:3668 stop:5779 length:2112 start_codon:yes stop_codon:yes gene_type:complete
MPKIPTFTTEARITGTSGSVTSNLQIPLNTVAGALQPLTDAVVKYKTAEQNASNKTEALELENQAIIKLNDVTQEISKKFTNSDEANKSLMAQSKNIKDEFAAKSSNGKVKTLFTNSYLLEEQKKIYSVDNKVYQNLIDKRSVASSVKEQNLLTTGIYGDNELAKETLPKDLKELYENDFIDGLMSVKKYETKIASIPNLIATFEVEKDMTKDPVQTYVNLDEGKYKGLFLKDREQLKRAAELEAKPILQENMINYLSALEDGKNIEINEPAIKSIFGEKTFTDFKETQSNTIKVSVFKSAIFNSKIGEEQTILNSFNLNSENYAQDKQYKEKVRDFISKKDDLIKKDAATLILMHNSTVRENYDAYNTKTNGDAKQQLFTKYINSVVQAQKDMGIDPSFIKVLPESLAERIVMDYNNQPAEKKIGYLQSMEQQYGEQYGRVLNQLTNKDLPVTAKLVSYFNDLNFATMATSIDTPEEKTRLDEYIASTADTFSSINKDVAEELNDFRGAVMFSNKNNTTKANEELGDIQKVITYIAINKMSAGIEKDKAIEQATNYIINNFVIGGDNEFFGGQDTYFIPRNYNNDKLSQRHIDFIQEKVEYIKQNHIQDFGIQPFKSNNPDISDEELNNEMLEQAKDNGVWINSPDGNGLIFAIEFSDGSLGLVKNKKGNLLQVNFDDDSYILPETNIYMDIKTKQELPPGA